MDARFRNIFESDVGRAKKPACYVTLRLLSFPFRHEFVADKLEFLHPGRRIRLRFVDQSDLGAVARLRRTPDGCSDRGHVEDHLPAAVSEKVDAHRAAVLADG